VPKRLSFFLVIAIAAFAVVALTACESDVENPFATTTPIPADSGSGGGNSGGDPAPSGPDLANGESKFNGLGCSGCHTTTDAKLVGPGLAGIAAKGDDFIRESIVDPAAVIADGYQNLMPSSFSALGESDLEDLIAYLKSL
jgi:cytochrome c oxidase subunit 2